MIELKCKSCGAALRVDKTERTARCKFCESEFLVDETSKSTNEKSTGPTNDTVYVPSKVDERRARRAVQQWLKTGVWTPGDALRAFPSLKFFMKYTPVYAIHADVETDWEGEDQETHYRTVTRTRTKQGPHGSYEESYVDNEPYYVYRRTSGTHRGSYATYLTGSNHLSQAEVDALKIEAGDDLRPVTDEMESSAQLVSPPWLKPQEAIELFEHRVKAWAWNECKGKAYRLLKAYPRYTLKTILLIFVPIWFGNYAYGKTRHRVLVNGTTGQVFAGSKPVSSLRIGVAVGIAIMIAVLAWAMISHGSTSEKTQTLHDEQATGPLQPYNSSQNHGEGVSANKHEDERPSLPFSNAPSMLEEDASLPNVQGPRPGQATALFDGTSLDQWTTVTHAGGTWRLQNGVLVGEGIRTPSGGLYGGIIASNCTGLAHHEVTIDLEVEQGQLLVYQRGIVLRSGGAVGPWTYVDGRFIDGNIVALLGSVGPSGQSLGRYTITVGRQEDDGDKISVNISPSSVLSKMRPWMVHHGYKPPASGRVMLVLSADARVKIYSVKVKAQGP